MSTRGRVHENQYVVGKRDATHARTYKATGKRPPPHPFSTDTRQFIEKLTEGEKWDETEVRVTAEEQRERESVMTIGPGDPSEDAE